MARDDGRSATPLKPADYHVLVSLTDGPLHGYAIAKNVVDQTDGGLRIEAGNLHRALRRMARDGLVAKPEQRPTPADDDPRRRYWTITPLGAEAVRNEARRLRRVVAEAEARDLLPRAVER